MCVIEDKVRRIEVIAERVQGRNNKNGGIIPMGTTPERSERYVPLDDESLFREKAANKNVKHCPGGIIIPPHLPRSMTKER